MGSFNPYRVLSVSRDMSKEEIKKVFRKLARKYHPDNSITGNETKFREINQAWRWVEGNHSDKVDKPMWKHKTLFKVYKG